MNCLNDYDTLSIVIAAVAHDVSHPGVNNRYLVNNQELLAMTYNDTSVLENMHSATTFEIMRESKSNLLDNFKKENFIYCRKIIIDMILETDMAKHFDALGKFRTKALFENYDLSNFEDKSLLLKMALKCADIGHCCKSWDLHYQWSLKIQEEFFLQGDLEREKSLPISMACDRETTEINSSQAGFLKVICEPLFESLNQYLKSTPIKENCLN